MLSGSGQQTLDPKANAVGSSLGPWQQLSGAVYARSGSDAFMGANSQAFFFKLTLPSHSSLIQNTYDYLTSLGPWPKPPPSSFLLLFSKIFAAPLFTGI